MLRRAIVQLSLLLLLPCSVLAQETVQFAGFAFLGDSANVEKNYPYSSKISNLPKGNEQSLLEAALLSKLKSAEARFEINSTSLADLKSGDTLSLAFALDRETIFQEKVGTKNKLVIELSAQALLVDFENLSIIGSYPMVVQYIDVPEQEPTDEYIAESVQSLYLGDLGVNIFDEFTRVVGNIEVKRKHRNRIQVTDVVIKDEVLPYLPEKFHGSNLDNFKSYVAQSFSSALSENQRVSVLPYTKGAAIGNKMAARFSNGEVYNLSIPETDYSIELTIAGFKKVPFDERGSISSWVYGAYVDLKVFEELLSRIYFEQQVKNGATRVVTNGQENIDDWPPYQETMLVLFDELTKQISIQDKGWSKRHMGDKGLVKELKTLEGVISRCR